MVRGVLRREKGFSVLGFVEDLRGEFEDEEDLIFNGKGRENWVLKEIEEMGVEKDGRLW